MGKEEKEMERKMYLGRESYMRESESEREIERERERE